MLVAGTLAPPVGAGPEPLVLAAAGPVQDTVTEEGARCERSTLVLVSVYFNWGQATVHAVPDDCSFFTDYIFTPEACQRTPAGGVLCVDDFELSYARLAIAPDGALDYVFHDAPEPTFHQTLVGWVARSP